MPLYAEQKCINENKINSKICNADCKNVCNWHATITFKFDNYY